MLAEACVNHCGNITVRSDRGFYARRCLPPCLLLPPGTHSRPPARKPVKLCITLQRCRMHGSCSAGHGSPSRWSRSLCTLMSRWKRLLDASKWGPHTCAASRASLD